MMKNPPLDIKQGILFLAACLVAGCSSVTTINVAQPSRIEPDDCRIVLVRESSVAGAPMTLRVIDEGEVPSGETLAVPAMFPYRDIDEEATKALHESAVGSDDFMALAMARFYGPMAWAAVIIEKDMTLKGVQVGELGNGGTVTWYRKAGKYRIVLQYTTLGKRMIFGPWCELKPGYEYEFRFTFYHGFGLVKERKLTQP